MLDEVEDEIVNDMEAPKADGKYVVIVYPTISEGDYRWIQSVRQANDPQFTMVNPHITLVFPFKGDRITKVELIDHVSSAIGSTKRFDFEIEKVVVGRNNSDFQVHILIGHGKNEITSIHDILYHGMLSPELRKDIPYAPHITVASAADKSSIQKLAKSINNESLHIKGTVDRITVGLFDGEKVHDLKTFHLQAS